MAGVDDIVEQSLVEEDEETKAEKEKSPKGAKTSKSTRKEFLKFVNLYSSLKLNQKLIVTKTWEMLVYSNVKEIGFLGFNQVLNIINCRLWP